MAEDHNILKLLIGSDEPLSIRKISTIRNINYKSAYNAVMKLNLEGVVDIKKLGNTNLCSFNGSFNQSVFSAEYDRREDILNNKDFRVIHQILEEMAGVFTVLLFGSWAKGKAHKRSDIDLLIISKNYSEIERKISLIPLYIHATYVSVDEFLSMAKSREFSAVSEAMEHSIILVGIEYYYRLKKSAGHRKDNAT